MFAAPPAAAAGLKWLHPMRVSRYVFSERVSPWMAVAASLAERARADRRPADPANPFLQVEKSASRQVSNALSLWRFAADQWNERLFAMLYGPQPGGA